MQLLVPIYNEGRNVSILYERLLAEKIPFDSLKFVYDFDGDDSLPYIASLRAVDTRVCAERNELGRGVLNAMRWGFSRASPGAVVVVMGDHSDKLSLIPEMIALWRAGATIVCPSRYMRGGRQHGGGLLKSTLSRAAGVSLGILGFPTSDPTNNFKLYDGGWLSAQTVDSKGGFEVSMELCYKAFREGRRIVELPTEWRDRAAGQSKFRICAWLPHYLRWYLLILTALTAALAKDWRRKG